MKLKIKLILCLIVFILITCIFTSGLAMQNYQTVSTPTGLVTATTLNVRQGPGTNYGIVTRVYKNQYIRLFAKIGDWYVVQTNNDYLGAVSSKYVKLIYPNTSSNRIKASQEPYYFKGAGARNYVKYGDKLYRIYYIDTDDTLILYSTESFGNTFNGKILPISSIYSCLGIK